MLERENQILRAMARPPKQIRKGMTVNYLGTHEFTTSEVLAAAQEAESSRKGKNAATTMGNTSRGASPSVDDDEILVQWILDDADA